MATDTGSRTLEEMKSTPSYKAHLARKREATLYGLQCFLELEESDEHIEGRKVQRMIDAKYVGAVAGSHIVGEMHTAGLIEFDMTSKSASQEGGSKFYKLTARGRRELRKHIDPTLKVQDEPKPKKKKGSAESSTEPEQE